MHLKSLLWSYSLNHVSDCSQKCDVQVSRTQKLESGRSDFPQRMHVVPAWRIMKNSGDYRSHVSHRCNFIKLVHLEMGSQIEAV